jgi:hypothetical protein
VSAWQQALTAADAVREAHGLRATTAWLDGIVGGRLGVRVAIPGGREVTGTPREIADLVAGALDTAPFPPGRYPYLVVADRLAERIRRYEFDETGKLPSARELMAHYGVSFWVIRHARQELADRGLVYSAGPHGTFVMPLARQPGSATGSEAPAGEAPPPSSPAGRDGKGGQS